MFLLAQLQRVADTAERLLVANKLQQQLLSELVELLAETTPAVIVACDECQADSAKDNLYEQLVAFLQSEDNDTDQFESSEDATHTNVYRTCLGTLAQMLVKHGHGLHLTKPPEQVFGANAKQDVLASSAVLRFVRKEYVPTQYTMWHALLVFYWGIVYLEQAAASVRIDALLTAACAFSATLRALCEAKKDVTISALVCVAHELAACHGSVDVTSREFGNALRYVECVLCREMFVSKNQIALAEFDFVSVRVLHARVARAKMCSLVASLPKNNVPLLHECDVYPLSAVKAFIARTADQFGLQSAHGVILKKLLLQTLVPFGQYLIYLRLNNMPPQEVAMMLYATQPDTAVNAMLDAIGGHTFHGLEDMMRLCEKAPLRLLYTLLSVVQTAVADKSPDVHERLVVVVDKPPDWDVLVLQTQMLKIVVCVDVFVLVTRRRVLPVGQDAWACLWALFNGLHKQKWQWDEVNVENVFLAAL
jgi:hypothetical protein